MAASARENQLSLGLADPAPVFGWGGKRAGAGRPRKRVSKLTPHVKREKHWASAPVHVTMRAVANLVSFREERIFARLARALGKASKDGFRVVQWSVQKDHVHVIAEADSHDELRAGAQGLAIRLARTFNRVFRRKGKVWRTRHERHDLRSPRQVRNALVYVLFNHRKHARGTPNEHWALTSLDPKSSAPWFDGFTARAGPAIAKLASDASALGVVERCVVSARRFLTTTLWWRHHGKLDPTEAPTS
jgi:REP element-mobilizing transposase RayT